MILLDLELHHSFYRCKEIYGENKKDFFKSLVKTTWDFSCTCFSHMNDNDLDTAILEEQLKRERAQMVKKAEARQAAKVALAQILGQEENFSKVNARSDSPAKPDLKFTDDEITKSVKESNVYQNAKRIVKLKEVLEDQSMLKTLGNWATDLYHRQSVIPEREQNLVIRGDAPDACKSKLVEMCSAGLCSGPFEEQLVCRVTNQRQGLSSYKAHGQYRFILVQDFSYRYNMHEITYYTYMNNLGY